MRRFLRILARLAALLLVLVVGLYLLRGPLLSRPLARLAAERLSDELGGKVSLERIEGSWFTSLVLVGLRAEIPAGSFAFERAEVRYDLTTLFGDRPQDGVRFISVTAVRAEVETRAAEPGADGEPFDPSVLFDLLPARLPDLELEGSATVVLEQGPIRIGAFRVAGDERGIDLELGDVRALDLPGAERFAGRLERPDAHVLRWTSESEWGGLLLESAELRPGWALDVRARAGGGVVSLSLDGRGLRADASGVDLARLTLLREAPGGVVDGHVEIGAGGTVRGELVARDVRYEDRRIDRLEAKGAWDGDKGRLETLVLNEGETRVSAREIEVESARPYYVARVDELDLTIPDLRTYLPDLRYAVAVRARMHGPAPDHVVIEQMSLTSGGTTIDLAGDARLPPDPDDWLRTRLALTCSGTLGDLSGFFEELPRLEGVVSIDGSITGVLEEPVAALHVLGEELLVEGRRVNRLELSSELTWPRLRLKKLDLLADPGAVLIEGLVDLEQRVLRDGSYRLDISDLAEFAALVPNAPSVAGSLQGQGVFVVDAEGLRGNGDLVAKDLVYEDQRLGMARIEASAADGTIFVTKFTGNGDWGRLTARGQLEWRDRTAKIEQLYAEADGRAVLLRAPLQIAWGPGTVEAEGLDLATLGGHVRGRVGWAGVPTADLEGTGLDLANLVQGVEGQANVILKLEGGRVSVSAAVPNLIYEDHEGGLSIDAVQDEHGIRVERLEIDAGALVKASGEAVLPWRYDPMEDRWIRLDGITPRLSLDVHSTRFDQLEGIEASSVTVGVRGDGEGLKAEARLTDVLLGRELRIPGEAWVEITATRSTLVATLATPETNRSRLSGTLAADRGIDWTRPLDIGDALEAAHIAATVDMDLPDLGAFRAVVPSAVHLAGRAHTKLRLDGPLSAPELRGDATLEGVELSLKGDLPPLHEGKGRVVLDGRTARIERFEALLGFEPLVLEGSISIPEAGGSADLRLRAVGKNILLARDQHLRLRADVDLALEGPMSALEAKGRIHVTDALYSRPIDLFARSAPAADSKLQLFGAREGPLSTMKFDVEISGDRSFRMRNNIVRGDFSPALRLRGTGAVPEPSGSIYFRDTLVRLPFTSLKVDQGEITFPDDQPFSPRMRVAAHTRMQGYDLDVLAEGVLPDVEVRVSAMPALTQEDALTLLTTGSLPEQLGEGNRALTTVGTYVGKELWRRFSGPEDPDAENILDRFSVEIGRDVSIHGQETIESEFRVSDRFYLRAERDRYDEYNGGVVLRIRFR